LIQCLFSKKSESDVAYLDEPTEEEPLPEEVTEAPAQEEFVTEVEETDTFAPEDQPKGLLDSIKSLFSKKSESDVAYLDEPTEEEPLPEEVTEAPAQEEFVAEAEETDTFAPEDQPKGLLDSIKSLFSSLKVM
jgi:hypothetical protein